MNSIADVLKKEDIEIIEKMAREYGITVKDLGKMLANTKASSVRPQVTFSVDEYKYVTDNAGRLNLSRGKYCGYCLRKAVRENIIADIDVLKLLQMEKDKKVKKVSEDSLRARAESVNVYMVNADDYIELKKRAKEMGVTFVSLARYLILTADVSMNDI